MPTQTRTNAYVRFRARGKEEVGLLNSVRIPMEISGGKGSPRGGALSLDVGVGVGVILKRVAWLRWWVSRGGAALVEGR